MPTTPKYGLRYPALSDLPNGPLGIQNLANDVDALGVVGGKRQTSTGAVISTIETTVVDTQTLALPANCVFALDFNLYFTASVAGNDCSMKIRLTSVSGTILGETSTYGVYVTPEVNRGYLRVIYKTTAAELDYFAGTIIHIGAGSGTITPVIPTSLIVTNLGPTSLVGDF
ncbi:MAG: hypothetical protein ACRDSP_13700 [Pseudonocardiaceae bacterium]